MQTYISEGIGANAEILSGVRYVESTLARALSQGSRMYVSSWKYPDLILYISLSSAQLCIFHFVLLRVCITTVSRSSSSRPSSSFAKGASPVQFDR
jgi:hypothetical protein